MKTSTTGMHQRYQLVLCFAAVTRLAHHVHACMGARCAHYNLLRLR